MAEIQVVGAVMDARDLTELQWVQDEAGKAVARIPEEAVLQHGLGAARVFGMAAKVKHTGNRRLAVGGQIEVRGHEEPRLAFKDQLLNDVSWPGQGPGDPDVQGCARWQGIKPQEP